MTTTTQSGIFSLKLYKEEKVKVLIVDDEDAVRMLLSRFLESLDYKVDTACDGWEASTYLSTNSYDLLITDYIHPGMDGAALARYAKHEIDLPPPRVIILTGYPESEILCETGAEACLPKPINLSKLKEVIEEVLSGVKG